MHLITSALCCVEIGKIETDLSSLKMGADIIINIIYFDIYLLLVSGKDCYAACFCGPESGTYKPCSFPELNRKLRSFLEAQINMLQVIWCIPLYRLIL